MYPVRPAESVKMPLLSDISRVELVRHATGPTRAERARARGRISGLVETAEVDVVGACGWPSDLIETAVVVGSMGACGCPSETTETGMYVTVLVDVLLGAWGWPSEMVDFGAWGWPSEMVESAGTVGACG
jgi:hypothetical protein